MATSKIPINARDDLQTQTVTLTGIGVDINLIRRGHIVYLHHTFTELGSWTNTLAGELPNGFKPQTLVFLTAYGSSAPFLQVGSAWMNGVGNFYLYKPSGTTEMTVSGCYIAKD